MIVLTRVLQLCDVAWLLAFPQLSNKTKRMLVVFFLKVLFMDWSTVEIQTKQNCKSSAASLMIFFFVLSQVFHLAACKDFLF